MDGLIDTSSSDLPAWRPASLPDMPHFFTVVAFDRPNIVVSARRRILCGPMPGTFPSRAFLSLAPETLEVRLKLGKGRLLDTRVSSGDAVRLLHLNTRWCGFNRLDIPQSFFKL